MGAPLFWMGASPVLVYNLLLLAGFALTGWAGWRLMTRWTGDWWAGLVAGNDPGVQRSHVDASPASPGAPPGVSSAGAAVL